MNESNPPQRFHADGVAIESIAFWSDRIASWPELVACWRSTALPSTTPMPPPPAQLLTGADRRRAPPSVSIALEVARQATERAGRDAATLGAVFASSRGDVDLAGALCDTLATDPLLTSPTKFHQSVHNAVAGYWSIATGNRGAITSLAAQPHTVAAALLEALCLLAETRTPVLLVAYDLRASGAMAQLAPAAASIAVALVLAPAMPDAGMMMDVTLTDAPPPVAWTPHEPIRALLESTALADAAPLLHALARLAEGEPGPIDLAWPLGPGAALALALRACGAAR